MRALLVLAALGALAAGCRPDLPGRDCAKDEDCFSEERCVAKSCVTAETPPDAAPDAAAPDAAPDATPDAAADAAP